MQTCNPVLQPGNFSIQIQTGTHLAENPEFIKICPFKVPTHLISKHHHILEQLAIIIVSVLTRLPLSLVQQLQSVLNSAAVDFWLEAI